MKNHEATDGLDAPALVTAGLVMAIGTFALIVGLQVLYLKFQAARAEENLAGPNTASSASLLAEQRSKINRYGWLDRREDVVAIPIDLAIKLTAQDLGNTIVEPYGDRTDAQSIREPSL